MSPDAIKEALMSLNSEQKKAFILETLPDLAKEVMQEPGFMLQLLPVMLGILKESGMDLQQLLQMAGMFAAKQQEQ